jgi:hypothetical protein
MLKQQMNYMLLLTSTVSGLASCDHDIAYHWSTAFAGSNYITDGPFMLQQNLSLS